MGFSIDFTDNKSISADELNGIIAEVGDGSVSASSQFVNDSLFYTDKLNCIRNEIVTGGISSGCQAVLDNDGVIIGEGLCFFDSGMRMKIDAEGISLVISEGEENFVYLYASPISHIATAVVSTVPKTGDEYVPICRIDAERKLYDERKWCRAKIPMMNSRFVQSEKFTVENRKEEGKILASFPLINKAYSYIIFMSAEAIALYCRDTNKYTYIVADESFGNLRRENMDYFRIEYYNAATSSYDTHITIKEEDSSINLYANGRQSKVEINVLII